MTHLPSEAEQEILLRDLAELIAACGAETFLRAPILEPTPRFLPDPWEGDFDSALLLLRRLMLYAGLDLAASVHVYDREDAANPHHIAWFAGIEDGLCQFGMDVRLPEEPEDLAAVFGHEVAHAWRERHGVVHPDRKKDEDLTDLTTVYLGFGILTANAADRYTQSGLQEGIYAVSTSRFSRVGYLSPQALSFLLAVQLVARGLSPSRCKAVERHLETNQAEYLARSLRHLRGRREEILSTLGLPPDTSGADEPDLERFIRPLKDVEPVGTVTYEEDVFEDKSFKPGPDGSVYALREGISRYVFLVLLGAMFGSWIGLFATPEGSGMGAGAVAGSLLALLLLGRGRRYHCSDTACRTRIAPGDEVCPGCGVRVTKRIRSLKEVYAEEELEEQSS